ncbi:hypothetical protein JOF56_001316 [Kibdelosporangium banguiense]|uniref:PBP domain-containing protein n=1 Tax=Kibdelosporangium banguiense TaxID=1365924 RepID=A0ABS4T9C6_9PSEU|nr:substrate-binding domain-containing protein [Kibdelosporangium banguiense]MBP2320931.1 hypothetical protein [Kibdelosporangium banguiense]
MRSILGKAAVTIGAAAAVVGLAAGNAVADPGSTPLRGDIVGVGSDTTQGLVQALADGYNAAHARPENWVASWDAFGEGLPTTIAVKENSNPATFTRPNGSSAGITALINDGDEHDIDFARSSRWVGTNPAEANYRFLQFARDGLTYATATTSNVPATKTTLELNDIYSRNIGNCVPLVKPYIPQNGSGTRTFFLASIGLSAPGTCVTVSQEHDPSVVVGDPNAIAPFSVARGWGVAGLKLNDINDASRPVGLPANLVANDTPPNGSLASIRVYDRGVYNVVRNADADLPKYANVFGPDGFICTEGADIITAQHFRLAEPENCGSHVK